MGYWVEVRIDKVVCRDPESVTTPDLFAMIGGVLTVEEEPRKGFVLPMRRLRKGQSAIFLETVFEGFTNEPRIGIVLRAWDKDKNRAWYETKEDIDKISEKLSKTYMALEIAGDILEFAAQYLIAVIDLTVRSDEDDELLNYREWIQLNGAGIGSANKRTQELEVRFSRHDPTGYSDWDYSVILTLAYYQTEPGFASTKPPTWMPFTRSRRDDWIGSWSSQTTPANGKPAIAVEITPAYFPIS